MAGQNGLTQGKEVSNSGYPSGQSSLMASIWLHKQPTSLPQIKSTFLPDNESLAFNWSHCQTHKLLANSYITATLKSLFLCMHLGMYNNNMMKVINTWNCLQRWRVIVVSFVPAFPPIPPPQAQSKAKQNKQQKHKEMYSLRAAAECKLSRWQEHYEIKCHTFASSWILSKPTTHKVLTLKETMALHWFIYFSYSVSGTIDTWYALCPADNRCHMVFFMFLS